jgi:hypothetical protein
MNKIIYITILAALLLPAAALAVNCVTNAQCAATPTTPICSNNVCVDGGQWFRDVINRFLNFIVWPIFIALSIVMFIYAGIKYLSAHGDPGHISEAHKAVIWGIVGIVVALLGFAATGTIRVILGL